jgi:hypothetical protein
MTPNGAIVFGLVVVIGAMLARDTGLAILAVLCLAFGAVEIQGRTLRALAWSAGIVAPLAAFMALVWIGIVGRAPDEIAAGVVGSRMAALAHVLTVSCRLFLVALVVQLVILRFARLTPLQFIRAVAAPVMVKKLTVLTLSLIDTILQAVDRARTALIAAGVVTPGFSMRNIGHGFILIQTVWLSVITIATGRLKDKWPAENTLARLDHALSGARVPLGGADLAWIGLAAVASAVAVAVR